MIRVAVFGIKDPAAGPLHLPLGRQTPDDRPAAHLGRPQPWITQPLDPATEGTLALRYPDRELTLDSHVPSAGDARADGTIVFVHSNAAMDKPSALAVLIFPLLHGL